MNKMIDSLNVSRYYDSEEETLFMKKLIIAGHGYYARGLKSSLGIISGSTDNVIDINGFTDECPDPEKTIKELMATEEDVLVMTDVRFGSINQYFMRELENREFMLVTGVNLPLAMELHQYVGRDLDEETLTNIAVMAGNEIEVVKKARPTYFDDSMEEL